MLGHHFLFERYLQKVYQEKEHNRGNQKKERFGEKENAYQNQLNAEVHRIASNPKRPLPYKLSRFLAWTKWSPGLSESRKTGEAGGETNDQKTHADCPTARNRNRC